MSGKIGDMDTSKIDKWFKVAVDSIDNVTSSDDWMVALFGRDRDGNDYSVVANHIHGSQMSGNPEVFLGAKGDSELVATLLNRWHSSRRSHPAMQEEMEAVAFAFNVHITQGHGADFEACGNLACQLAVMLEQAYGWIDEERQ